MTLSAHRVRSSRSWWLVAIPAVLAVALVAPSPASASGIRIQMSAADHNPVAGKNWPIKVVVRKRSGKKRAKVSGRVSYKFLLGSVVVATRPGHRFTRGIYRDTLKWPKAAVGHALKLRVVVKTRYGRASANWRVKVRR